MIDHDDIAIEFARLEREAHAKVRERMSKQQLGEAWVGIPDPFTRGIFNLNSAND